jgi:hypothetical protein
MPLCKETGNLPPNCWSSVLPNTHQYSPLICSDQNQIPSFGLSIQIAMLRCLRKAYTDMHLHLIDADSAA